MFENEETFESMWEFELPHDPELHNGQQNVFRFPNNMGASVVSHDNSYGKQKFWELAVIRFFSDDNDNWDIVYDTPITQDVLGWLTIPEVLNTLQEIKSL